MIVTRLQKIGIGVLIVLVLIVGIIGIYFLTKKSKEISPVGVIVANGEGCAEVGGSILQKNGNAVEAAIATLFCEGILMAQSCGIGGGFLMTIYEKKTGQVYSLNSREVAPLAATEDMFHDDENLALDGPLSVAVFGEVKGYWEAYKKFGGNVPWHELVQPTIDKCKNGFKLTDYTAKIVAKKKEKIYANPDLRAVLINPKTNQTYVSGDTIYRVKLAKTLEQIAKEGGDALNNGTLTPILAKELKDMGSIITEEDLRNYSPKWQEPIKVALPFEDTLFTTPLPGSGVILSLILNIAKQLLLFDQPEDFRNYQRLVESFKFAYGVRTQLGDKDTPAMKELVDKITSEEFATSKLGKIFDNQTFTDPAYYEATSMNSFDHGTAHVCVLSPNGDAVSVTTTVNQYYGSGIMTPKTGIILNDEMDDFASPGFSNDFGIPPSVPNYIKPGRSPISSMVPSIILDKNKNVKMIVGAAGGSKITTTVAQLIVKNLWYNKSVKVSIDDKRVHHQLIPMKITLEDEFAPETELLKKLKSIGHTIELGGDGGFAAATMISKINDFIEGAFDKRRMGTIFNYFQ